MTTMIYAFVANPDSEEEIVTKTRKWCRKHNITIRLFDGKCSIDMDYLVNDLTKLGADMLVSKNVFGVVGVSIKIDANMKEYFKLLNKDGIMMATKKDLFETYTKSAVLIVDTILDY